MLDSSSFRLFHRTTRCLQVSVSVGVNVIAGNSSTFCRARVNVVSTSDFIFSLGRVGFRGSPSTTFSYWAWSRAAGDLRDLLIGFEGSSSLFGWHALVLIVAC